MSHRTYRMAGLMVIGIGLILTGFAVSTLILTTQNNINAESPTDFSAIPAKVQIEAPALSLNDIQGVHHSLSDYRGRVVLVNLWATWCPPCQAEMPVLEDFYKNHQNEGFTVIAVEDGDPPTAVKSFVQKCDLDFSVW